jgi:hypothetical protein
VWCAQIWLTIVQRREGRAHPERMNYLLENCPLIYYKLFSGFTVHLPPFP